MQSGNNNEKKTKKNSWFKKIFTGEILTGEESKPIFLYGLFIVFLFVIIILMQQSVDKKEALIRKKQTEYKNAITRLKQNNNFIPYEQNQELIKKLEEQGFSKQDRHMFKIEVEKEVEK